MMTPVSETTTPLLVLLVEDDLRLGALTREYREGHGVAVVHVTDGKRGLSEALAGRFDAVLLDLMLPGKDGLEVCRELRARSDVPRPPRGLRARPGGLPRRAKGRAGPARSLVNVGGLTVDPAARRAT